MLSQLGQVVRGLRRRINRFYWRRVLASLGAESVVDVGVRIHGPGHITIGRRCTINEGAILQSTNKAKILIGDNVTLSYDCKLLTGGLSPEQMLSDSTLVHRSHVEGDIVIGEGAWVAAGSIVLPGITIGSGAIVGAGSVVTRDVPANVVVGGIPARVVRRLDEGGDGQ